jgi:SAM-dependent methyltransferase
MDDNELRRALGRYKFYHVIRLTDGVQTPGWSNPDVLRTQAMTLGVLRGLDLAGKRVLDVGCRDGLFSFAAERQGAAEVVGIDNDLSRPATEFLIPYFRSRVRMHQLNVYDLTPEHFGAFDVVICAGVLYHLRCPFWGLKRLGDVLAPGGLLVLETALRVDDNREALLYCPVGADSPYEPTSCAFFNEMGLTDTLKSLGLAAEQVVYLNGPRQRSGPLPALRRRLRDLRGRPPPRVLDRATFTCRRTGPDAVATAEVQQFWFGTHKGHTGR